MDYIEVKCNINTQKDVFSDIFIAELANLGYESFTETGEGFLAYIPSPNFNENYRGHLTKKYPDIEYTTEWKEIKEQNWNELWEQNYFNPILIDDECVIRSPFHLEYPKARFDININPKMSFGTGHHETTRLMVRQILKTEMTGKKVLDMGCGTGILAILAAMKGAKDVTAVDFDKWAYNNCLENIQINNVPFIKVILGTVGKIRKKNFDIILANINRNVLLKDFTKLASLLASNGKLIISGFYEEDVNDFQYLAENNYLAVKHKEKINNWTVVVYEKNV